MAKQKYVIAWIKKGDGKSGYFKTGMEDYAFIMGKSTSDYYADNKAFRRTERF